MINVYIVSGFLGAGKTTFIQKLLKEKKFDKVMLLENEFGEVGVDSAFFDSSLKIREINNGCICCSLQGDFEDALEEIWTRFPKFILGFFAASLIASFLIQPIFGGDEVKEINNVLNQYKNWAFVLAFTSIGLDTNFREIGKQLHGGKVVWLYVIGQLFNIALTFLAVWLLLSGVLFEIPVLELYK